MKKTNKRNKKETLNTKIRLNKYLADAGVCSRRKADELIQQGAVTVNGGIIIDLGTKVDATDDIKVFGDAVKTNKRFTYILINKPKNTITTTKDENDRKTIMDIINSRSRVYPVGRLDRNTTGVMLLTNDGELTYRLTHPKYQIQRIYSVKLDKELKYNDAEKIAAGVEFEDVKYSPCELFINPKDKSKITLTLTEGKNHEVRKIFESRGYIVKQLDRKMFAGLTYQGLGKSKYRHLDRKELISLKKLVNLE